MLILNVKGFIKIKANFSLVYVIMTLVIEMKKIVIKENDTNYLQNMEQLSGLKKKRKNFFLKDLPTQVLLMANLQKKKIFMI